MRKLSNLLTTKVYVPNTLGSVLLLTPSLLGNILTLIFLYLTSILNIKAKCVLFMMTETDILNVKRLFKNNYQNASSGIVTFL